VGNVTVTCEPCPEEPEDSTDGGFILDDENIARLVSVVQNIASEAAQKQTRLLGQNLLSACHLTRQNNMCVKSIRSLFFAALLRGRVRSHQESSSQITSVVVMVGFDKLP